MPANAPAWACHRGFCHENPKGNSRISVYRGVALDAGIQECRLARTFGDLPLPSTPPGLQPLKPCGSLSPDPGWKVPEKHVPASVVARNHEVCREANMEDRHAPRRHHDTPSVGITHLKASRLHLVLPAAVVAVVALGIGSLLLDWNPETHSVISGDETRSSQHTAPSTSPAGGRSGAGAHSDSPMPESGSTDSMDASVASRSSTETTATDSHNPSIKQGEDLIARINARLATNPVSIEKAEGSDAAFHARVETLRAEIEDLRKELKSSSP